MVHNINSRYVNWSVIFTRKEFLSLAFSMVCLMAILDFHSLVPMISAPMRLIHWAIIAVVYISLVFRCNHRDRKAARPNFNSRNQNPHAFCHTNILCVSCRKSTWYLHQSSFWKNKRISISLLLEDFAPDFIVCLGMDAISAVSVLPYIAAKNQVSQEQGDEIVEVFGEKRQLSAIHYLRAVGRQIVVIPESGETKISAKFSDVVDRLPVQHGALIHRSDWITHKFVQGIKREGQKTLATTKDGRTLSASRTLRAERLKTYPELSE